MTSAGGVEMPAAEIAVVTLDELVIHGWDLARSTGQPYEPDPADVAAILGSSRLSARRRARRASSGRPFPVPDDAPPFDRALGLSGRDPAWRPAGRCERCGSRIRAASAPTTASRSCGPR